jgi:HEAT repeat protein
MTDRRPGSPTGEPSPAARDTAHWLRQCERLLALARVHGRFSPVVRQTRERLVQEGMALLAAHGPLDLECAPGRLRRAGEPLDLAPVEGQISLSNFFYRNGLKAMHLAPELPRASLVGLLQTLIELHTAASPDHDLATRLWEHPLPGVGIEPVPVPGEPSVADTPGVTRLPLGIPAWVEGNAVAAPAPSPLEPLTVERLPASPGLVPPPAPGPDWLVPAEQADAGTRWRDLHLREDRDREQFLSAFERERSRPWTTQVREFVDEVRSADPSPETREAVMASLVTWVAAAAQRCDWAEAQQALDTLRTLDPAGTDTDAALANALSALDAEVVRERLDEATAEEQARFFALAVALRTPALDLVINILAGSGRSRLRAAATTALAYTCSESPQLLTRHLHDSRWHVVRNIVFVLGQIGGPAVTPLLAMAARHVDTRVRRAVVQALGQVPATQRIPLLLQNLDTHDRTLLAATLQLLAREPDARVAQALVTRILAADFESLPGDRRIALLDTLGDVADDQAVPALEQLLQRGGWFARQTPERDAAAQTLARIGTPLALAVLHAGTGSRSEAVRVACQQALAHPGRTA